MADNTDMSKPLPGNEGETVYDDKAALNGKTETAYIGASNNAAQAGDETVYAGCADTVLDNGSDETVYAQACDETVFDNAREDKKWAEAEQNVALEWNVGDTILDLYDVLPVDDTGKAFHAGGFGKVYKVRHKTWNTDLAVKAPHAHVFKSEAQKQNFISECRAWIELGLHPNIATCYYVRELGDVPRIFAEYVAGGSLKEWIKAGRLYEGGKQAALKRILDISIQFAWGLHYAHEKGLIHQDVKPHNVMMTQEGEAKVVDFGLARAKATSGMEADDEQQSVMMTSSGGYTPAYCSPEQMNQQPLSRRTDIWSWGVSVLEMFAGEATWQSGVIASYVLESFLGRNEETDEIPAMPEGVVQLLRHCFAENEADRPHTMLNTAQILIGIYDETCGEAYPRRWQEGASDSADALNNRALSYLDLGDEKKAEALWDQALRIDPRHVDSTYNLGLMRWRTGRATDVELIEKMNVVRERHKDEWMDEYLLGLAHMEQNDMEAAITLLERAAEQSGRDANVMAALETAKAGCDKDCRCLHVLKDHNGHVNAVTLNRDGRFALSGGDDKNVMLWDTGTGECLRVFHGHTGNVNAVKFSPDGRFAISGGSPPNGYIQDVQKETLKYWNILTGECLKTFVGYENKINAVDISPDGRYALTGSNDRTARLWDVSTGECLSIFQMKEYINSVSFSINGQFAYAVSDGGVVHYIWEVFTDEHVKGYVKRGRVSAGWTKKEGFFELSALPESDYASLNMLKGPFMLSRGPNHKVLEICDVKSGRCIRTLSDHTSAIQSADINIDNRCVISGSWDGTVRLWRIGEFWFKAPWKLSKPESGSQAVVRASRFEEYLTETKRMCTGSRYNEAAALLRQASALPGCERLKPLREAWCGLYRYLPKCGLRSGWEMHTLSGHGSYVKAVAISPDSRFVLSGSSDNTMKLWELETGECLHTFEGHTGDVEAVVFSPEGRYVVSGSRDKTIKLWDIGEGECLRTFTGHELDVGSVAFSSDGRYILSGSNDRTMRVWNAVSKECIRIFNTDGWASRVMFDEGGRSAICLSGYTLNIWNIASGICRKSKIEKERNTWVVGFNMEQRCLIRGGHNMFKLNDLSSGECKQTFDGSLGAVHTAVFSKDGRFIISGDDNALKIWEASVGECLHTYEGHEKKINTVVISPDGRYVVSGSDDHTLRVYELTWELEERSLADRDDRVEPYLKNFLEGHRPVKSELPLLYEDIPEWTPLDLERLMSELGHRGLGWLRPEGIEAKLEEMKASCVKAQASFSEAVGQTGRMIDSGDYAGAVRMARRAGALPGFGLKQELIDVHTRLNACLPKCRFEGKRLLWGQVNRRENTKNYITVADISPNGRYVMTGYDDGVLELWDAATGKRVRQMHGHNGTVKAVAFGRHQNIVFTGGADGMLKVWDLKAQSCVRATKTMDSVYQIVIGAGDRVALIRNQTTAELWDTENGTRLSSFKKKPDNVLSMDLSTDGRFALFGCKNNNIILWDMLKNRKCSEMEDRSYFDYIRFCPGERLALVGGAQNKLWDIFASKCLKSLKYSIQIKTSLFSAENRFAFMWESCKKRIDIWDTVAYDEGLVRFFDDIEVKSMSISVGGQYVLIVSNELFQLWETIWDYEEKEKADWDDGATAYLKNFLVRHDSVKGNNPLKRLGKPVWTEKDFEQLVYELKESGYGWLRPKGVLARLEKMREQYK